MSRLKAGRSLPRRRRALFGIELLEGRTLLSAMSGANPAPPPAAEVVSIKAADAVASESAMKSAALVISRAGPLVNSPLTVQLAVSGPVVPGTDFTFGPEATPDPSSAGVYDVTIPAGSSSVNLAVNSVADAASDGVYFNFQTLTVQLQVSDPTATTNPSADIADVRIYDGDDPQPPAAGYSFGYVNVFNGTSSQIEPLATTTDSSGDVYLVGTFSGSVNLNPAGTAVNYNSPMSASAFIAKYTPSGALLWSKVYIGASDAWASGVALDNNGNVIVGGRFLGSVDFNPSVPNTAVLTTPATQDGNFVVKLTADGNFVWAQQIGGIVATNHGVSSDPTSLPDRTPVATDANGNLYVGGDFAGTASLPGTQQTLTSQGGVDMFIVKLGSAGGVTWAEEVGGPSDDMLNALSADGAGQVYATGSFGSTVNFGSTPLTSAGVSAFALKLASSGAVDWAGAMGGGPNDSAEGNAILADASGNVYLAGDFRGTVDFDPGPGVVSRTGTGGAIFVEQLSASGAFGWVQTPTMSGDYGSIAWGLAQDSQGSLYASGFFSGTLSLGSFGVLGASGPYDTFIAKFRQSTGEPQWGTKIDGMDGDLATGIAADGGGNLYLAGNFSDSGGGGTDNFDPFNHTAEQSAAGSTAGFLWKLTGPAIVNMPPAVIAASFDYANVPPDVSITFDGDVSASLTPASLVVQNLTTGAMVAAANVTYNHASNTATFSFAGPLPDGDYRATLPASGVTDSAGGHLVADYVLNFFVLAGDANHDRSVGFDDLLIVGRHYGQAGTFADGDLNGDGKIGFDDLIIVARAYGHSLPPTPAAALSPLWPSLADYAVSASLPRRRHRFERDTPRPGCPGGG